LKKNKIRVKMKAMKDYMKMKSTIIVSLFSFIIDRADRFLFEKEEWKRIYSHDQLKEKKKDRAVSWIKNNKSWKES